MAKDQIDVGRLYAALDGAREERGLSWRSLAKEIGVSPSLMARLSNGYKPDADGFMTLTGWLKIPAESFIAGPEKSAAQPELMSELTPLLRARNDLDDQDIEYLEEIFGASVRLVQKRREKRI